MHCQMSGLSCEQSIITLRIFSVRKIYLQVVVDMIYASYMR